MSDPLESSISELPQAIRHAADCYEDGLLQQAAEACAAYIATHPGHFDALHLAGVVKLAQGDSAAACPLLAEAVRIKPRSHEALLNHAIALLDVGDMEAALAQSDRALALLPDYPEALNSRGNALRALGRPEEALEAYEQALRLRFRYVEALSNRAAALVDLEQPDEALASLAHALKLRPDFAEAHYIRGNAFRQLGRHQRALVSYDQALLYHPGHDEALANKIAIFMLLDRDGDALEVAREAAALDPRHVAALISFGIAAQNTGKPADAVVAFDEALGISPDLPDVLRYRALALRDVGDVAAALAGFDSILKRDPNDAEAHYERGRALASLERKPEALLAYERALELKPDHAEVLDAAARAALTLGEWEKTVRLTAIVEQRVVENGLVVAPDLLLMLSGSPKAHHAGAKNFAQAFGQIPAMPAARRARPPGRPDKIRIAYVSPDFCEHPVAHLIADVVERHDRTGFRVDGFCLGSPEDGSEVRARLMRVFDRFHIVRGSSDAAAARGIRELDVDIAIDLSGYAKGGRPGIFAARPAPTQVSWLGYPATMGVDFIDYVIADPIVLPPGEQPLVSEKIVHLPDCYRVRDIKRAPPSGTLSREAAGLPATGFVFCCFADSLSIRQPAFGAWMRLLIARAGSVLWLRHAGEVMQARLRREAKTRSVDPSRLIFAKPGTAADDLARCRIADLCLDTLPCNADAFVGDALWAGVPVITCKGSAFPGRIGASLATAAGLPDLVAPDLAAYEARALRLSGEPEALAGVRKQMEEKRPTALLFDLDRFRGRLEAAFLRMQEARRNGKPPESFTVESK